MDCPVSAASSGVVINPPLTFLIDTTRSVKPDKDSIFNLTQRVVDRIQETNTNIPQVRQWAGIKSYVHTGGGTHTKSPLNAKIHPPLIFNPYARMAKIA